MLKSGLLYFDAVLEYSDRGAFLLMNVNVLSRNHNVLVIEVRNFMAYLAVSVLPAPDSPLITIA